MLDSSWHYTQLIAFDIMHSCTLLHRSMCSLQADSLKNSYYVHKIQLWNLPYQLLELHQMDIVCTPNNIIVQTPKLDFHFLYTCWKSMQQWYVTGLECGLK